MTTAPTATEAAATNAAWCAAVCASHGIATRVDAHRWWAPQRTPDLYPDAQTLTSGVSTNALVAGIDVSSGCAVKDSFADVDLAQMGFAVLFEARWLWFQHVGAAVGSSSGDVVSSAADFDRWTAAWGSSHPGDARSPWRLPLLHQPGVHLFSWAAGGNAVTAGCAVFVGTSAATVSNTFAVPGHPGPSATDVLGAAASVADGRPLTGYDPSRSSRASAVDLGPLRVWTRD